MLDEEKVVIVDKLSYRNRDCSNHLTEDKRPSMEEDKIYYKFFNEWRNIKEVLYENKMYEVNKDSYDGIVWFTPIKEDIKRLALSDLKPRTKTVYEKVDLHINKIAKIMIDGDVFYNHDGSDWFDWKLNGFRKNGLSLTGLNGFDFYRKVEKEIDWRDEVSDFVIKNKIIYSCNGHKHIKAISDYTDEQFLEMCRVALRATGELE